MGIWERRVLGVLALGGAFTGVVLLLATLMQDATWFTRLLLLPVLAFYAWGIVCGIQMLEGSPDAIESNTWYWIVQIPCVVTPLIGGFLTSGASVTIGLQSIDPLLFWAVNLGTRYKFAVFDGSPITVGVNLLAVAAVIWLKHRAGRAEEADADVETDSGTPPSPSPSPPRPAGDAALPSGTTD
jgi:hypothetical protein